MADHAQALASERRMLWVSTIGTGVMASVGILWGMLANSQIILFDGVYALIGLVLGGLSLRASALVEAGPTPHYPFGREALAPLVVGVQGLVMLGTFGYACFDAIMVILDGGSDTDIGSALVYGVVSAIGAGAVWWTLRTRGRGSELVAAEAAQWASGLVFSVAMIIGFSIALGLLRTDLAGAAAFIDPVLVLVAAALFAPMPLKMLRNTYRELLEAAPSSELVEPIHAAIVALGERHGLPTPVERIGKLGRKVYIELDYLVPEGKFGVADADRFRRELLSELERPGQLLWLNVELHTDPDWDSTTTEAISR